MREFLIIFFLIIISSNLWGQSQSDSLINAFYAMQNDSLRVDAAIRLYDHLVDRHPDSLYSILEHAIMLADQAGFQERKVKLLTQKGTLMDRLSNYLEAQKNFIAARNLLDSIRSALPDTTYFKHRLSISNSIAIIYMHTNKLGDAKSVYEEMLQYLDEDRGISAFPKIRDYYMVTNQNLGSVYLLLYDYDQAETYFLKAISYLDPEDKKGLASILNNLGIIEKDRSYYEKSYDYLSRAARLRRETGNPEGLVQALNNLGHLYFMEGKNRQALDTLQKSLQLSRDNKYLRSEVIALELISGVYAAMNDYRNAYLAHQEFKAQYDSLKSQETLRNLAQLEMQQRFEERMQEEKQKRQQEDLKRQKRDAIYLFITITSLLLLAILVMLYSLQRGKFKRHQLEAEKDRLSRKSLELENEKLSLDLEYKNKELTTNVIYLTRTNEFISSIAEKLKKNKLSFTKENQKLVDELVWELHSFSERDTWKEFEVRFQEVHNDFYNKLMERFPDLSINEKKLCAFLRLNMTTKEISAITYQSINSITVARSRLRKKLGIDQDENLIAFLEQL